MSSEAVNGDRRPTIIDVAAAAGVSRGTVSRVINGGHWVSPEARRAVEKAIRTTGYRANVHARSLVTGRSSALAFLLTETTQLIFEDRNFALLARGANEEADRRGLPLVLLMAGTPADRERVVQYVEAGHVDGVMLVHSRRNSPTLDLLIQHRIPVVVAGIPLGYADRVGAVTVDEIAGGRAMTGHLIETGRSMIATITGPVDDPASLGRLEGHRSALGTAYDPGLVAHATEWSAPAGRIAMAELLARRPDLDAVFAHSDSIAAGAVAALRAAGRAVPDDVAVGGFNDSGLAETTEPALTTMRQPFERISAEMVRLLGKILDGEEPATITVPATLIRRASA